MRMVFDFRKLLKCIISQIIKYENFEIKMKNLKRRTKGTQKINVLSVVMWTHFVVAQTATLVKAESSVPRETKITATFVMIIIGQQLRVNCLEIYYLDRQDLTI